MIIIYSIIFFVVVAVAIASLIGGAAEYILSYLFSPDGVPRATTGTPDKAAWRRGPR